jgi:hypothetical protein
VDTRSKIVTAGEAPRGAVLVAGSFDVPGPEQVRELQQIRQRHPAGPLLAAVLPCEHELLGLRARGEMAAALRVVDYVLIVEPAGRPDDLDRLVNLLQPAAVIRLEDAGVRRFRRLIEHAPNG